MNKKTLTRMDLSEALHEEIGLSKNDSSKLVDSIMSHISNALVAGDSVKISNFGSFLVREKRERMGRNPKTGEEAVIDERRVISFRASHHLKKKVLSGNMGKTES
ncbi:MAG: integration host factor subunit alpha [Roseovarius sp.]|nr:integration host factor subunit alpha [Roseovarius sp.]MCY4208823.1 integration host factor subunit alpha [Roseovarius sp.]MCY4291717.1 integration host factor subunit alpha [Roseovarius sp.]